MLGFNSGLRSPKFLKSITKMEVLSGGLRKNMAYSLCDHKRPMCGASTLPEAMRLTMWDAVDTAANTSGVERSSMVGTVIRAALEASPDVSEFTELQVQSLAASLIHIVDGHCPFDTIILPKR